MKTLLTWVAIIGCTLFGYRQSGGNINELYHQGSVIMVFGPILAYLMIRHGWEDFFGFFKRVTVGKTNGRDLEAIDKVVMLGFLLGTVTCMFHMIHMIGRNMNGGFGAAFLGILYGIIPAVCFWSVTPANHSGKSGYLRAAGYAAAASFVMIFSVALLMGLHK